MENMDRETLITSVLIISAGHVPVNVDSDVPQAEGR